MLKRLRIKNIGLIADLSVEFGSGLNVLTGETGAGKSMILSALTLVLGERAGADMTRDGAQNGSAEAVFDSQNHKEATKIFEEQGIYPEDGELIVRRVIQKGGKNRAIVNGAAINLATLKKVGETMVDIHGQHDHQTLLRKETHLPWLDHYLELIPKSSEVAGLLLETRRKERELEELLKKQKERLAQKEFLEYKIEELDKAQINPKEEAELESEQKLLANAENVRQTGARLFEKLYESDSSVISEIEGAARELEKLKELDSFFKNFPSQFNDISAQLSDAAMEIQSFCSSIEDNPARLEEIEERQALLEKLKRKYRCDLKGLVETLDEAKKEFDAIESAGDDKEKLENELAELRTELQKKAGTLHAKRVKGTDRFKKEVEKELADLNMPGARFEVEINLTEDTRGGLKLENRVCRVFPHGFGEFQFLISANEGSNPKPLVKIASGGEISRIMLALKKATGKTQPVPILVFDEIDAGIGGKTADMVGEKLKKLSQTCQIFCITHLPQIARQADLHFVVEKSVSGKKTDIKINRLDDNGRVEELARMGAGREVTDAARKHAREMISR